MHTNPQACTKMDTAQNERRKGKDASKLRFVVE
jgi:hypothetical protein